MLLLGLPIVIAIPLSAVVGWLALYLALYLIALPFVGLWRLLCWAGSYSAPAPARRGRSDSSRHGLLRYGPGGATREQRATIG